MGDEARVELSPRFTVPLFGALTVAWPVPNGHPQVVQVPRQRVFLRSVSILSEQTYHRCGSTAGIHNRVVVSVTTTHNTQAITRRDTIPPRETAAASPHKQVFIR